MADVGAGSKMADEGGEMLETRRRSVRIWALEEEKKKKKKTTTASVSNSNHLLNAGIDAVLSLPAFKTNSTAGVPRSQVQGQHKELPHARPPTFKQYDRRRVKRKRLEDVVVSSPAYFSPAQVSLFPVHNSLLLLFAFLLLYSLLFDVECTMSLYY